MKVSQFMRKTLVYVDEKDEIRKAVKLIFNLSISGIPVVKDKKLIGIITEQDVLEKLFPTMQDYMEDRVHGMDFDYMEQNLAGLLSNPVKSIMSAKVHSVKPDTTLMHAQSRMILNKCSRLPVVNSKNELIGIISQGDVFRAIVGSEVPYHDTKEFYEWASSFFESLHVSTGAKTDISDLDGMLKKNKVQLVLDIRSGTGLSDIALAKKDYEVLGLNHFDAFHKIALSNYKSLNPYIQRNLTFVNTSGQYGRLLKLDNRTFDAAISLYNGLSHHPDDYNSLLKTASDNLRKKGAVMIFQITNYIKILEHNNRLQKFTIAKSKISKETEYAYIELFDPAGSNKLITFTISVLANKRGRWEQHGINSTQLLYVTKERMPSLLNKFGFTKIEYYGSCFGEPLFKQQFDKAKHDWLNVVAIRP